MRGCGSICCETGGAASGDDVQAVYISALVQVEFADFTMRVRNTLELELIGDLAGDILEADGSAADALKAYAVQRQPRQFADLRRHKDA